MIQTTRKLNKIAINLSNIGNLHEHQKIAYDKAFINESSIQLRTATYHFCYLVCIIHISNFQNNNVTKKVKYYKKSTSQFSTLTKAQNLELTSSIYLSIEYSELDYCLSCMVY